MMKLRKITYMVHVDQYDDDGNVVSEGMLAADGNGAPHTIFASQLDRLPEIVRAAVDAAQPTDDPT